MAQYKAKYTQGITRKGTQKFSWKQPTQEQLEKAYNVLGSEFVEKIEDKVEIEEEEITLKRTKKKSKN